jgi:NhaP-type Na+/H+ or K+/H+ antiporter
MDWKTRTLLITIAGGAIAGYLAGMLYIRQVEEAGDQPPVKANTTTLLTIALAALSVVRQIAALGKPAE